MPSKALASEAKGTLLMMPSSRSPLLFLIISMFSYMTLKGMLSRNCIADFL